MKIRFWFTCSLLIGTMVLVSEVVSDKNIVLNDQHRVYDGIVPYMHADVSISLTPLSHTTSGIPIPRSAVVRESLFQRVMDVKIRSPV